MDDATVLKKCGYIMGVSVGEGTFGKVKSAYSKKHKANVAVKIIDIKKANDDVTEKFLQREMEILTLVKHKNIVRIQEIFKLSNEKIYIIMELAVHGDLLAYIQSRGSLPEDMAQKMFHQLTMAIQYCHGINIVHRDLKCENLLLDVNYDIKLTDFGFSRHCVCNKEGHSLLSKTFCGSAAYTAPEVLLHIPYEPKVSDIWSMGVILFVMVFNSMPYDDSNVKKMVRIQKAHKVVFPRYERVTSECKALITSILHPDVMKRLTIEEILVHPWMQCTKHERVDNGQKDGECSQTVHHQKEQPRTNLKSDISNGSKSQAKAENDNTEAKAENNHPLPDTKESKGGT
ncbi:testis-specific serine/threonine-protein kinase 1-like [Protopterus annectens]|uniref:testis-specific serine/threonine-protein kinase 1-like n=1 Tax=Protopterus annectens TaxID=7888 RepID=UPI001CF94E30|nr:testis-specific serine/threonine-protein kinase 1-like [Protopterus annectens]